MRRSTRASRWGQPEAGHPMPCASRCGPEDATTGAGDHPAVGGADRQPELALP